MEDYLGTYKNRPRTVVFYGRVSTEHEQQISALGNQMEWYANLAERNPNWTVVAQYIDEGITGTQMKKRPSFMQMMDHARQRQFDLIVTRELSRFARNTVDALKATRELKQYGVEVYFVNDGIWTMDGDGEVRLTIMASIAQDESRKTSERVKAGQKISRENGVLYGNGNVLGYDLDKVNKTYTINEEQADTVRRVYELYANGYGETAVANMLMAEGRKDGGGGCTWTASKVSRVLRKPVYKGYKAYNQSHVKDYLSQERIYHSERDYSLVKGDFPPIVSEKLWDTCFAIRKNRAAHNVDKEGRTYGFGTGFPQNKWAKVLYCECGARYQCEGHDKRRNGRSDVRLMCSATKKLSKRVRDEKGLGVPCPLPNTWDWKMEMIAKKMYQTIWVTHNDDLRKLGEELNEYLQNNTESPEVISLKKQLEDLNGEMDKLVQGRAQSRISLAEFMKMSTQVNEKVMATEKALQEAEQQNSAEEQLDLEKLEASLCDSADFSGGEINEYFLDVYVRRIIKSGERYIWLLSLTEKIKPKPPETKEKPRIQQIRTYKAGELVNPETTPDIVEQKKGEKPYVVPPMRTHGFLLQEGDAKRRRHLDYRYEDCQSLHMSFLAEPIPLAREIIDFEEASDWQRKAGVKLHPARWRDISVEIYLV